MWPYQSHSKRLTSRYHHHLLLFFFLAIPALICFARSSSQKSSCQVKSTTTVDSLQNVVLWIHTCVVPLVNHEKPHFMASHNSGFAPPFLPVRSGFAYDTTGLAPAWTTITHGETVVVSFTNTPSPTNATPKASKGGSTGIIVGGLLGGLTFITLLMVALIFYRRRRHRTYPNPTPLIHDPEYTQPPRRNEKLVQVLREQDEARRQRTQLQTTVEQRNGEREGSLTWLQIELLRQRILALEAQQRELDNQERGPEPLPEYSN